MSLSALLHLSCALCHKDKEITLYFNLKEFTIAISLTGKRKSRSDYVLTSSCLSILCLANLANLVIAHSSLQAQAITALLLN